MYCACTVDSEQYGNPSHDVTICGRDAGFRGSERAPKAFGVQRHAASGRQNGIGMRQSGLHSGGKWGCPSRWVGAAKLEGIYYSEQCDITALLG